MEHDHAYESGRTAPGKLGRAESWHDCSIAQQVGPGPAHFVLRIRIQHGYSVYGGLLRLEDPISHQPVQYLKAAVSQLR